MTAALLAALAAAGVTPVIGATPRGAVETALAANQASHAEPDDGVVDTTGAVRVRLTGRGASVSSNRVRVSGSTVTIGAPGTYLLKGRLEGRVVVASPGDGAVRIILAGASISSPDGAAIEVQAADEARVLLAGTTVNTLVAGRYSAAVDAPSAALHSRADLTLGGTGRLIVRGGSKDGIATSDGLVVLGGRITVTAKDEGIRGKDYVIVEGGSVTVRAKGDGIRSDNAGDPRRGYVAVLGGVVDVSAADGIAGRTDVIVGGGRVSLRTAPGVAPGASAKGLKAGALIVIGGGTVRATTRDDAVHSDGSAQIERGTLLLSTGDDAVHAEKRLSITDGTVTVKRSREGLEATTIVLAGGRIQVRAEDDGISVATGAGAAQGRGGALRNVATPNRLIVSGGVIAVDAGSDGIDANGSVVLTGGTLIVTGPTQGFNGAIDADAGIEFSGGLVFALGSMSATPQPRSTQGWMSAALPERVAAGAIVQIAQGELVLAAFRARQSAAAVVFSGAALEKSKPVDIYVGGTMSGQPVAGLSPSGSLTGARKVVTVRAGVYDPPRGPGGGP